MKQKSEVSLLRDKAASAAKRGQRSFFLMFACMSILSALGGSIYAQEVPTITVSKGDKINLTVSPLSGSDGAAVTKRLVGRMYTAESDVEYPPHHGKTPSGCVPDGAQRLGSFRK